MAAANSSGGVMGKMIDAQSMVVASTATNRYGHEGTLSPVVVTAGSGYRPGRGGGWFSVGEAEAEGRAASAGMERVAERENGGQGGGLTEAWGQGRQGPVSVAGNTVIFVAGPLEDRA